MQTILNVSLLEFSFLFVSRRFVAHSATTGWMFLETFFFHQFMAFWAVEICHHINVYLQTSLVCVYPPTGENATETGGHTLHSNQKDQSQKVVGWFLICLEAQVWAGGSDKRNACTELRSICLAKLDSSGYLPTRSTWLQGSAAEGHNDVFFIIVMVHYSTLG